MWNDLAREKKKTNRTPTTGQERSEHFIDRPGTGERVFFPLKLNKLFLWSPMSGTDDVIVTKPLSTSLPTILALHVKTRTLFHYI